METFFSITGIVITSAVFGCLWVLCYTEHGNVFDWWPNLAMRISKHPKWLKLAYDCEKCIAGQIALWWTLFNYGIFASIIASIFASFLTYPIGKAMRDWSE
jgi:hypothetical protein